MFNLKSFTRTRKTEDFQREGEQQQSKTTLQEGITWGCKVGVTDVVQMATEQMQGPTAFRRGNLDIFIIILFSNKILKKIKFFRLYFTWLNLFIIYLQFNSNLVSNLLNNFIENWKYL
jgi:hypothetical protein